MAVNHRIALLVTVASVGVTLTVAFPGSETSDPTRWVVDIRNAHQVDGIVRAAEARG